MIKVNLLGEEVQNQEIIYFWSLTYAASILLVLIGCLVIQHMVVSKTEELGFEKRELEVELMALKKTTESVQTLEKKKEKLRSKLAVIARLKKSKIGPVRVLDDLNTALPAKVWLRDFEESKGVMRIKGRALDNTDITQFMRNLGTSPYFKEIDLVESRQMYYSQKTGKVSPMKKMQSLTKSAFSKDTRRTKQSGKVKIKTSGSALGKKSITIKEFVLEAKVSYSGKDNFDELEKSTKKKKKKKKRKR